MAEDTDNVEYDASDIEQVKVRKSKAKLAQGVQDEMLRALMDLPQGRKFMWWLLEQCNTFGSAFGPDTHLSYLAGGRQEVGKLLFAEIMRVCPDRYLAMVKEKEND